MKKMKKMKEKMLQLFDVFIENKSNIIIQRFYDPPMSAPNTVEYNIYPSIFNPIIYEKSNGYYVKKKYYHRYDYNFKEMDTIEKTNESIVVNFSSQPPLSLNKRCNYNYKDETIEVNLRGWRWFLPKEIITIKNIEFLNIDYTMKFGSILVYLTEEEFESRMRRLVELEDKRSLEFSENQLYEKLKEYIK